MVSNHLVAEETAGCFALIVVAVPVIYGLMRPCNAVGWSGICNCGISWSYSHTFCKTPMSPKQIATSVLDLSFSKVRQGHIFW